VPAGTLVDAGVASDDAACADFIPGPHPYDLFGVTTDRPRFRLSEGAGGVQRCARVGSTGADSSRRGPDGVLMISRGRSVAAVWEYRQFAFDLNDRSVRSQSDRPGGVASSRTRGATINLKRARRARDSLPAGP
jgi:hypothetical protein